jgi:hypothetical protein
MERCYGEHLLPSLSIIFRQKSFSVTQLQLGTICQTGWRVLILVLLNAKALLLEAVRPRSDAKPSWTTLMALVDAVTLIAVGLQLLPECYCSHGPKLRTNWSAASPSGFYGLLTLDFQASLAWRSSCAALVLAHVHHMEKGISMGR